MDKTQITDIKTEKTDVITLYLAGDVDIATQACREFCFNEGLCVTVTKTNFVYTGGAEGGVAVGLLNYPRFPSTEDELRATAHDLAFFLMERLVQHSVLVVGPKQSIWMTRREHE